MDLIDLQLKKIQKEVFNLDINNSKYNNSEKINLLTQIRKALREVTCSVTSEIQKICTHKFTKDLNNIDPCQSSYHCVHCDVSL